MNKKGSLALAAIAIILAFVILGVFLIDIAQRECNSNKDCPVNAYCGSEHECHSYPEEIIVQENSFIPAALIFGAAIIIAAYIFRGGKVPFNKKKES